MFLYAWSNKVATLNSFFSQFSDFPYTKYCSMYQQSFTLDWHGTVHLNSKTTAN